MRSIITGSGIGIPKNLVRNEVLGRIMDTSDEWIRTRSGIEQRYYAEPGEGSAELGMIAARNALAAAERETGDIDALVFATMTPNYFFPGNGPVMQAKMGFGEIPTFDIRQQCSGFLYGLDLADSLIRSGKHRRVLLVGAEVHTPFMPWEKGWDITIGRGTGEISPEDYAANTAIRDRTVLFGDGAGAVVVEASENGERGLLATKLFTDGSNIEALYVPGVGFRKRPYVSNEQIAAGDPIPVMEGRAVFKEAVSRMPAAVRAVCAEAGMKIEDIDVLLIHQANLRIVEGVAKQLGLAAEKVPHNIERYGNTTAGTLPILYHECVVEGRIRPGMLVCFTALGSGLHWGAALYRA
ncbi:MAG TPA: 3-oxoacyl-[acyl-carrier-protein] synthase III C-terminal domain-containing protein [Thermoanaerobaculia bacterium]|jgi:3-oxoacyl-[acyl-carrier-protein] synthase-3|nr:3-oxoacyl-[acyl-carrier-protein] synthase III C-terminal domain-containing protein [Thermoanaerobaculia bacterium]